MSRRSRHGSNSAALLGVLVAIGVPPSADAQPSGVPDPDIAIARTLEIQCAPRAAWTVPVLPVTVIGSQDGQARRMFGPGDAVILSLVAGDDVSVGDEYYVRRQYRPRVESIVAYGEMPVLHTAGWVRVVAVESSMAIAVITHACDGVLTGDYLEPFSVPDTPAGSPPGTADYEDAGRILFSEDGGYTAGIHRFAVIDRGRDAGVVPGQRFTLFRETIGPDGPVSNLGNAFAVLVDDRTATVRIFGTRDAVYAGDRLAMHP